MTKSIAFASNFLKLVYQAVAWANMADNAAAAPLTNIYWALHTATPGTAGDQTTNEITYTSYARQAVARTSGGHAVTNNVMNPVANVVFPASTGATPTATHFSTGSAVSGAGNRFHHGTVTPNIVVSTTVPQTLVNSSNITEN
jgi:hypothetical protein